MPQQAISSRVEAVSLPIAAPRFFLVVFCAVAAYHPGMDSDTDASELRRRLVELIAEHRDLDEAIARMATAPPVDELLLHRLKKRKLQLKDRIALIERMLEPDVPA